MIGTPTVTFPNMPDVDGGAPLRNADFADGLDGWLPYPQGANPWTVDADGVHPGGWTPNGNNIGLVNAPSNMGAYAPPLSQGGAFRGVWRLRGHTPQPGLFTMVIAYANDRDDSMYPSTRTSVTYRATAAGAFDLTLTSAYSQLNDAALVGAGFRFSPDATPRPDLSTFTVNELSVSYVTGNPGDFTCLVDQVAVRHGRDDATGQPEPSSATFDLTLDTREDADTVAVFAALDIGSPLHVDVDLAGTSHRRFTGTVSDISVSWEDAGADTPHHMVAQVIAVSSLGWLGRRVIGDVPWEQELDGARAEHIFAKANQDDTNLNAPFEWVTDPGLYTILRRDVDSQPALDLLHSVAQSAGGVVWQRVDGVMAYADANHRSATEPVVVLDACDVLVSPTWKRDLAGLVNLVSLGYGEPLSEGAEQQRLSAKNRDSIHAYGNYGYTLGTELATRDDAAAIASDLLFRWSTPVWNLAALPVDMVGLDAARTAALLSLDMHALIQVTNIPEGGTTPNDTRLWVEGWSETISADSHQLEIAVTDYARGAGTVTWDNWGTGTWDQTDPALTWNEARTAPVAAATTKDGSEWAA